MKKIVLTSLSVLMFVSVFSQDYLNSDDFLPKVIPSSPEMAALGKYADIPISNHTGTPNISIPIYEINVDGYKLPISLSYHASGIKINEQASWVGLGWALNAGDMVSRTVFGKDDFQYRIGLAQPFPITKGIVPDFRIYTLGALYPDNYADLGNNRPPSSSLMGLIYDTQPDLFTFNFNGRVGKFAYDKDGEPLLFPHQDLKIINPSTFNYTAQKIIDEQGVTYIF